MSLYFPEPRIPSPRIKSPPRLRSLAVFDRDHLHYINLPFRLSAFAYVLPSHCAAYLRANVIDLFKLQLPRCGRDCHRASVGPLTHLLTLSGSGSNAIFPSATIKSTVAYPQLGFVLNVQELRAVKSYDIKHLTSSNGNARRCRGRTLVSIYAGLYAHPTPKIQKNRINGDRDESNDVKVWSVPKKKHRRWEKRRSIHVCQQAPSLALR